MELSASFEQALDCLSDLKKHKTLTENDRKNIDRLSVCKNHEIRLEVTELLAFFPCEYSEKFLIKMTRDKNRLVRASACDSLCFSRSPAALSALKISATDGNPLVRGYAVLSIGDISGNTRANAEIVEFLKDREKKEKNPWVKIAVYRSLFVAGEPTYAGKLLQALNSKRYQNRCFAVNLLSELAETESPEKIPHLEESLEERLLKEEVPAVRESILSSLKSRKI